MWGPSTGNWALSSSGWRVRKPKLYPKRHQRKKGFILRLCLRTLLIHPLYHYRLAKLYEDKAWTGKAIEHYEKFLDFWKDADPGFPEVDDAYFFFKLSADGVTAKPPRDVQRSSVGSIFPDEKTASTVSSKGIGF